LNPRPKTFHKGIYIHILNFDFRGLRLLQAGCFRHYPVKFNLTLYRHSGLAFLLVDAHTGPAGIVRLDGGSLSGYCVVIIVCDYVFSAFFTSRQKTRYAAIASLSPSKPFRPLILSVLLGGWLKIFFVSHYAQI